MVKKSLKSKQLINKASPQDLITKFGLLIITFVTSYVAVSTLLLSNLYPDYTTEAMTYFYSLQTPLLLFVGFALGYLMLGRKIQNKRFAGVVMALLAIVILQTTDTLRFSLGFLSSPASFPFISQFYSELATILSVLFSIFVVLLITFIFKRANVQAFSSRQMSTISLIIVFQSLLYPLNYIISGFFSMDFATKPLELLVFAISNPFSIIALIYLFLNRFNRTERLFYATLVCAMYTTLSFSPSFDGLALSLLSIVEILLLVALILLAYKLRLASITSQAQ